MTIVITSLFFVSFFNIVGLRVPKRELIVSPPSYCTTCDQKLRFLDLVPVFSILNRV
ncbi:prepilin peptidase [Sporosarcina psychrophila]|uniref:prepilin peptidase n=1 Tax=Sporosarcina psychrophila TaxID=1476 RepID=UPI0033980332